MLHAEASRGSVLDDMGRELPQGRRVGNYAVERLLGKGGLSAVYAARQALIERPCVLTVFHLDPEADPWLRFRREVEQMNALKHPAVIETLDVGTTFDGIPYLVTELIPGEDLATRLRTSGALTLAEALALSRQVGAALHAAHAVGVVHRDIRPGTLFLVSPDPETEPTFERVKVLGFGVGRLLMSTVSGMALVGAPEYMAPEQILGNDLDVGPRADQYALAVVLYQALTTTRPFLGDSVGATLLAVARGESEPLRALRPDIPVHVEDAIHRALSRDPEARFPDLMTFLQALQEGVPLPVGVAELTEPWLSPPSTVEDAEAAEALLDELGATPAAPLSLGVSAALSLAKRARDQGPELLSMADKDGAPSQRSPGTGGVPQFTMEMASATMPYSMESVMRLAVPGSGHDPGAPHAINSPEITKDYSGPLEFVAEAGEPGEPVDPDGRPLPAKGETLTGAKRSGPKEVLPSIIVDLPTRPIVDGERLPSGVAAPGEPTRLSTGADRTTSGGDPKGTNPVTALASGEPPGLFVDLGARLGVPPRLVERVVFALGGACAGGLLVRLLS